MILNGYKINNLADYRLYFNLKELWKKQKDFILFLKNLSEEDIDYEDSKLQEGLSKLLSLISVPEEGNYSDEMFSDLEGYEVFVHNRKVIEGIVDITDSKDRIMLLLLYTFADKQMDEIETGQIKALFKSRNFEENLKNNTAIPINDGLGRLDIPLYTSGGQKSRIELKEIKNDTAFDREIHITHNKTDLFTYRLRPQEVMYCSMLNGEFVKKIRTLSMGRTYCAFYDYKEDCVRNISLIDRNKAEYVYPGMIGFSADRENGILGFSFQQKKPGEGNVIAAVDLQDIPCSDYVVSLELLGCQYAMLTEQKRLLTNIYGSEDLEDLIDVHIRLNEVIGISHDRTLASMRNDFPYENVMEIALYNEKAAVLTWDGKVFTDNPDKPVYDGAQDVGICSRGIFVLNGQGAILRIADGTAGRVDAIGEPAAEISVSDWGILYRTFSGSVGIYCFESKVNQIIKK